MSCPAFARLTRTCRAGEVCASRSRYEPKRAAAPLHAGFAFGGVRVFPEAIEPFDDPELPGVFYDVNGQTSCDIDNGVPSTDIFNAGCSKTCTQKHEARHFEDIKSCCAKAAAARKAAKTEEAKTKAVDRFIDWGNKNRAWLECRAYRISVDCAEDQLVLNGCSDKVPPDPACCNDLRVYKTSVKRSKEANCAAAEKTNCPF